MPSGGQGKKKAEKKEPNLTLDQFFKNHKMSPATSTDSKQGQAELKQDSHEETEPIAVKKGQIKVENNKQKLTEEVNIVLNLAREERKGIYRLKGRYKIDEKNGKTAAYNVDNENDVKEINIKDIDAIFCRGFVAITKEARKKLKKAGITVIYLSGKGKNSTWILELESKLYYAFTGYMNDKKFEHYQHRLVDSTLNLDFSKTLNLGKLINMSNLIDVDKQTLRSYIKRITEIRNLEGLQNLMSAEANSTEYILWDAYLRTALKLLGINFEKRIRYHEDEPQDIVNKILDILMSQLS